MNAHNLIAIALAALLVFAGGAAALPGDAPDNPGSDAADDHAPEDPGADADDVNETETNETDDDARDENASEGPPTDLPEPVPDHVSEIHQLIRDKLNGDLGNTTLGEAISGVVGGDDDAAGQVDSTDGEESENAGDESANADEQSTAASASVVGNLPQQAADHVSAIHDAISSFLNGDGDSPGDAVSAAAQG